MGDLNSSIKTVFVSIFDMVGNQLATTSDQNDVFVVSFRYKYSDEDEDVCIIKLQMKDPKALDKFKIERGTKLQCVWGYLSNPRSPIVTVVIKDLSSKYGSEVIYTELECTDYLSYLKITRSDDVGEGTLIGYIKAQVYGRYNILIKDRGIKIYAQVTRKSKEDEDQIIPVGIQDPGEPYLGLMFDPLDEAPEGSKTILISKKPTEAGTWFVDDSNPIRMYLENEKGILTSNRSTYVVLQDMFRKCPRGPWFVTGRGNTLFIHNRHLGKTAYKRFKYKSDNSGLIDFTAKTKFENFDKELVSYAGMDPQNRKNFFIDDYRKALLGTRNPKEILEDRRISDEEKRKEILEYLNLRKIPYPKFGTTAIEGAYLNPGKPEQLFVPGHYNRPFINRDPYLNVAVPDNTNIRNPDPFVRSEDGDHFDPYKHDPILRAIWYTMPIMTYEEAVNTTNNRHRELAMEKEEASAILEGDPWLKSELTIQVTNVHRQHEGHYYVKECEHIITNQGYKTELDCLKVVPEAMITTLINLSTEEYEALSDELKQIMGEQYKREQYLFGADLKIHYVQEDETLLAGTPGPLSTPTVVGTAHKSTTLNDLFKKYGNDDAIDELIKLSSNSKTTILFEPDNQ